MLACKVLVGYGIINVKYHGMPKKRYFKLNISVANKLYKDCLSAKSTVEKVENKENK